MHELSIAMSIVEFAEEESERRGGLHVTAVHLRLGLLAGVARDALLSCYDLACESTNLAGSRLIIEEVPGLVHCTSCNMQRPVHGPEWFRCHQCGSPAPELIQGKELLMTGLEFEE